MYYKITTEREPLKKPVYIADMGTYNRLPEPWKEISNDRYYHLAFIYMPHAIEFRQVREFNRYLTNIYLHYFHKYALGIIPPNKWECAPVDVGGIIYTEPIRYLYIGCEHELSEKTTGNCLHEYTCKLCGFQETVDSSD